MPPSASAPTPVEDAQFGTFAREPRLTRTRGAEIGEFAVRPGVRVREHGHEGEVLFLVLEGARTERGRIGDRAEVTLPAGKLRVLPAGDRRQLTFGPDGATCLVVELDEGLGHDSGVRIRQRALSTDPYLLRLALRLREHLDGAPRCRPSLLLDLDLLELLAQVARVPRSRGLARHPPRWLKRVRDRLEDAVTYPNLDGLGEEAGVHPLHVLRAFRAHYGCSMGDVVRRTRLEQAYRRVVDSARPLADVAALSGFSDQAHMTREFRRAFGLPPARLRKTTPPG